MSFQRALAYRLEYFVGLANAFLYIFIFTSVWTTVSTDSPEALGNWTGETLIAYAVLSTVIKVSMFRNDQMIPTKIKNGDIIFDLLKPYYYPLAYVFDGIGGSLFQIFARSGPLLLISIFIYDLDLSGFLDNLILFFAFFALGYILFLLVGFVLGAMGFFFTDVFGFYLLYFACTTLFSGSVVPIDLFPEILKQVTLATPFPYFFYYPVSILMGRIGIVEYNNLLMLYFLQISIWAGFCVISYSFGKKKLEILGG
ncbi:ABC transporter permease [Leptospira sp. GIMC2001]|uniref:ABC transporter permease n=1 Tax=Leptospira sp. GIMC2001 TaxID=1513297 RepID=UPI0004A5C5B7|nr:ABC-2 family transporter protein [Leptospira sp. GIMC2001]AID56197.1 daunorubicin resistance transmembrane protein [Leptospira sp. GIMC2001]WCL48829.1 ABC-2 family transporter protein [Leptospira sp. GIMC2001]